MTKDEALELAIDALENAQENYGAYWPEDIRALYEALAQPDPILAEREACAKLCEEKPKFRTTLGGRGISEVVGQRFAEAIRQRSHP